MPWKIRMTAFEELFGLAKQLEAAAATANTEDIEQPLKALQGAANQVALAFSGSWLGYHSRVYYEAFATPPPGKHFSQEWGFHHPEGGRGGWREYSYDVVEAHIETLAKHPNLDPARDAARHADGVFDSGKAEIISVLETELATRPDSLLSQLKDDLEKLELKSPFDIAERWSPKGQMFTRDKTAMNQGFTVPAHIKAEAQVVSLRHSFEVCKKAAVIAKKAASHLERQSLPSFPTREPTGWDRVDRVLEKAHTQLSESRHEEDYQAVGLSCREIIISLGQAVYDPALHKHPDGTVPSGADGGRMIEAFLDAATEGGSNEYTRKHARAALNLAVHLQHKRTANFKAAALCLEATSSVANILAILVGRRDPKS
jgi:hypothetical protein